MNHDNSENQVFNSNSMENPRIMRIADQNDR